MREAKQTAEERLRNMAARHPWRSLIVLVAIVLGCFVLMFWFVVFSGLSSTADFVYAGF